MGKAGFRSKGYSPVKSPATGGAPTGPRPSPGPADAVKITRV
jgi:hypothetical protein